MKCARVQCKTELVYDDERGCHYCPVCHPPNKQEQPVEEKPANTRIDVPWTDERVIKVVESILEERVTEIIDKVVPDLIRDTLAAMQKPEIVASPGGGEANVNDTVTETWRETAKRLEVPMYDNEKKCPRTQVDIMADIEAKIESPE